MKIKLLYFAQLKDAAGVDEQTLEVNGPVTVREFMKVVLNRPMFEKFKNSSFLYAINGEFAKPEQLIENQATFAILPPVAGG
ncbi:MAG: hypothetical protein A2Z88_08330 [Omnitrophica WOR_2 bacterium GWA2_47_8]|nr:MAG: hypothetical protein A2Z88_08330 [Omnitrophica WOR_2 bacterium GWA2_47_8]